MAFQADVAVLTTEAATFDRITGDLTAVRAQVEAIAASSQANLVGKAGDAAQAALMRYREAADQQNRLLQDISENIHIGGVRYDTTDDDNASTLTNTMGSVLGG